MSGITFDLTPIWEGINNSLPMFLSLFGPILGISIAMALVVWIGAQILKAFRGGGSAK